jgi:predicted nucleic acid-binding Zn ribbon protein
MADAPLTKCPTCGKDELQKIISATAFHLKGGGWYKDLYSSSKPGSSSDSGGGVPTSGSKSESKAADGKSSESKPESKASDSSSKGSSSGSDSSAKKAAAS